MVAHRREFVVGEVVGNNWVVMSSKRVWMPIKGRNRHTLGIRVRCHCGLPFAVSISNLRTQLGCGCSSKNKGSRRPVLPKGKGWMDVRTEYLSALALDPLMLVELAEDANTILQGGVLYRQPRAVYDRHVLKHPRIVA